MKTQFLYINIFLLIPFLNVSAQEQRDPSLIHSIFFGGGSYYIDRNQIQELNKFLDKFEGIETYEIIIHSHTDNIGSLEYNRYLSRMRSWSTLQQLLQKGLNEELIFIEDYGEENPVYDNATMMGKLHNRRVDVILKPPIS